MSKLGRFLENHKALEEKVARFRRGLFAQSREIHRCWKEIARLRAMTDVDALREAFVAGYTQDARDMAPGGLDPESETKLLTLAKVAAEAWIARRYPARQLDEAGAIEDRSHGIAFTDDEPADPPKEPAPEPKETRP